jgi:hypothetical protein
LLEPQSESVTFSVVDRRAQDTSQRAIVNSRFTGVIGRKSGIIGRKSGIIGRNFRAFPADFPFGNREFPALQPL